MDANPGSAPLAQDRSNRSVEGPGPSPKAAKIAKRANLFRVGDPADAYFEIVKGSLLVYREIEDGRRQAVDWVRAGDFCGFADGPLHDASCEALEPVSYLRHRKRDVAGDPDLAKRLQAQVERQVASLHDHLLSLGRKTAAERLATLLMRHIGSPSALDCPVPLAARAHATLHLEMTRAEVADYLGLTIETVCRALADLSRHRMIEVGGKRGDIEVLNVCALCHMAKVDVCQKV